MTTCENITFIIEETETLTQEDAANISETDNMIEHLFSSPKKKKKKDKEKDKLENEETQTTQQFIEDKELAEMFDLKLKKRKKEKKDKEKTKEEKINKYIYSEEYDPPSYSYETLLNKLYSHFENNNIKIEKNKNTIKLPVVHRVSSKKTGWVNFKDCCISIDRDQSNIVSYITNELSTQANIDGNGTLIIKGIYHQKNIENVLRKYVINYVQCSVCKSLETTNRKDQNTRINFLDCKSCKSSRALQQIVQSVKVGEKKVSFKE